MLTFSSFEKVFFCLTLFLKFIPLYLFLIKTINHELALFYTYRSFCWLLGRKNNGGKGFGFGVNLLVGIGGAIIGGWLLDELGIYISSGLIGSLITALIGAIVLLFFINLIWE